MFSVVSFQGIKGSSRLALDKNDGDGPVHVMVMRDGHLEAYMQAYQLMPGEALELLLLDWYDDTVEVPPYLQEDMYPIVQEILTKTHLIDWQIDRNETLAAITVKEDTAPELVEQWREQRLREEDIISGHELRQQQLLAEDIVSDMDPELLRVPRAEPSAPFGDQPVGLAIQFV